MTDLVRWLGEQLDTDERIARAVQQPDDLRWRARHMAGEEAEGTVRWDVPGVAQPTHVDPLNKARMEHIAAWDPARVLREIDARQQLLGLYAEVAANDVDDVEYAHGWANALGVAVRLLAAPYSDRPGFREEWSP